MKEPETQLCSDCGDRALGQVQPGGEVIPECKFHYMVRMGIITKEPLNLPGLGDETGDYHPSSSSYVRKNVRAKLDSRQQSTLAKRRLPNAQSYLRLPPTSPPAARTP